MADLPYRQAMQKTRRGINMRLGMTLILLGIFNAVIFRVVMPLGTVGEVTNLVVSAISAACGLATVLADAIYPGSQHVLMTWGSWLVPTVLRRISCSDSFGQAAATPACEWTSY
ncbi:unnamed protein product [Vitrella brassicaformis CCMP3155]|uniref:Uncharacterized protein n=1 Tax=Vitrella brassicaformis (strain CCMP3155) TaxID=1169540 RepID=A0A0G4E8U9_VITBC|nr:unnamed protein product [Vitrella brassicaformis CCMP3155]|eukprot:CEL92316.1 unnamed protein product [Vitrella brassicaformis CCMP3155]